MKLFDLRKRKNMLIDFSDENILELTQKSDLLVQTLNDIGLEYYIDHLSKILLAANNKNESEFKKLVISRELFGGSGALWEIHIENLTEYKKFNQQFSDYIDLLLRMGIKNNRVKQVQKTIQKLK